MKKKRPLPKGNCWRAAKLVWFLLILAIAGGARAQAVMTELLLPAKFLRVTEKSKLHSGGHYVVAGCDASTLRRFGVLLPELAKGVSGEKCLAEAYDGEHNDSEVTWHETAGVWQLLQQPDGETWRLRSAYDGSYLQTGRSDSDVRVGSEQEGCCDWLLRDNGKGAFVLTPKIRPERHLSVGYHSLNKLLYFGTYSDERYQPVMLYRMAGEADTPDDGGSEGSGGDGETPGGGTDTEKNASSLSSDGVLVLSGEWETTALAQLDFTGARMVDMTAARFETRGLRGFEHYPTAGGVPLFVKEEIAAKLPESWPFVVSCGANYNELKCNVALTDAAPFFTDRPFCVGTGEMTYERVAAADGAWESIALPFKSVAQGGAAVYVPAGMTEADTLLYKECVHLEAFCGALVCGVKLDGTADSNESNASTMLRFVSLECEVRPASPIKGDDESVVFLGASQRYDVTENTGGVPYMLNAGGDAFVRAAAGSWLRPYRAVLFLPSKAAKRQTFRPIVDNPDRLKD